jgi:chromosome transmission fidelity protein 4
MHSEWGRNAESRAELNPFARKPAVDASADPFNRDQGKKTVRKSESFFSKVEAAETGAVRE